MTTPLGLEQIRKAPKALLHDHLDGGLRPSTVVEIADQIGYDGLPTTDVDELATWFRTQSHSGSLERYLEPFSHTVAVMQTPDALHRVAYECVEDLAADSVVYAEIRFAPELHIDRGLSFDAIVDAVLAGFADGEKACAAAGRPIVVRLLVTAMRHAAVSREIAAAGNPVPGQGSRRFRYRRRRGRQPADAAPGRLRVHARPQRALHHSCR